MVSSAEVSERMASAHTPILVCSSFFKSEIKPCETHSEATTMSTAPATKIRFTRRTPS